MGNQPVQTVDPDSPAPAQEAIPDSCHTGNSRRHDPQHIAYDLWCLQENRRLAGQPLAPLEGLIQTLRVQHPGLEETDLARGVEVFLNHTFMEIARSHSARQRFLFEALRPLSRPVATTRRPGSESKHPPLSTDCTVQEVSGYNGKNGRMPTAGLTNTRGTSHTQKQKNRRPKN